MEWLAAVEPELDALAIRCARGGMHAGGVAYPALVRAQQHSCSSRIDAMAMSCRQVPVQPGGRIARLPAVGATGSSALSRDTVSQLRLASLLRR